MSSASFKNGMLKDAESNYDLSERKCLAIVLCVQKKRQTLHGESFKMLNDHLFSKCLMSLKMAGKKLRRWMIKIQNFQFVREQKSGQKLFVSDTLRRKAVPKTLPEMLSRNE